LTTQPIVYDSVEGAVQSIIKLCIVEESNKKLAEKARVNSVNELEKIIQVSNTKVECCDVTADSTVQTEVADVNEDRLNLERFEKCLNRYEALALAQKPLILR